MALSDDTIRKTQELLENRTGRSVSWSEAEESANNLAGFFKVLWDLAQKEQQRKKQLETEPNGFPLEGSYSCYICGHAGDIWYDKYGYSCPPCLAARKKRIIPVAAYRDRNSWYAMWELDHYLGIKSATARKMLREGSLKARVVYSEHGRAYYHLFLVSENAGVLPKKAPLRRQ